MKEEKKIMPNIIDIYEKYYIPENLQLHMLRVAACAKMIIDNWEGKEIDKEAIIRVSLLHDMGNIIKMPEEDLENEKTKELRRKCIQQYGEYEHNTNMAIGKQEGLTEKELDILDRKRSRRNLKDEVTREEMEKKILNTDIIYIGGGNTRYMLEKWREYDIQTFLKKAYEKEIVLAGYSAGSYCMFEYNYELIQGMNLITAINCVHYDEKSEEKKQEFKKNIFEKGKVGIALENGIALEIIEDRYRIIKSIKTAKAYRIDKAKEQEINNKDFLEIKHLF